MSAVIRQLVMRKRAGEAQAKLNIAARDAVIAQAKGAKGEPGEDGRGIVKTEIIGGDLVITYTDKKKQNVGKVVGQTIIGSGGAGGFDLNSLPPASAESPQALAVKVDGTWVQYTWQAFLALIGSTGGTTPTVVQVNGSAVTMNGQTVTINSGESVPVGAITSGGQYVTVT